MSLELYTNPTSYMSQAMVGLYRELIRDIGRDHKGHEESLP